MSGDNASSDRRDFFRSLLRYALLAATGTVVAPLGLRGLLAGDDATGGLSESETVWQIDPVKCIQCGKCATHCVLGTSAVKCVHDFDMCGYCKLCLGFFKPNPASLDSGAENQACPTGAIKRTFIEAPYYEYEIDEDLCVGCALCVKGCQDFGNGSFYLQVRHDLCVNCNECNIALNCPADAFIKVPTDNPYIVKNEWIAHK